MKHIYMNLRHILLCLCLFAGMNAYAYDAYIDGIYYNFSGNDATVTYGDQSSNSYTGDVVIPEIVTYNEITYNVTVIGRLAFSCTGLTSVTIPESVTTIEDYAFGACDLTGITIPKSVTSIGSKAFTSCYFQKDAFINHSALTSSNNWGAKLYDTETSDGLLISGNTVIGCRTRATATSVTIPAGITSIGGSAFSGCTSLTTVTIPNGVRSIGELAFWGCTSLTSITIPSSVTSISEYAFYNCTNLTAVYITDLSAWCKIKFMLDGNPLSFAQHLFLNGEEITELVIPDNITEIGNFAFCNCTSLTSVTISDNVTSIGYEAFVGCTGLTSVTIPDNVTSIGEDAFGGCTGLTSVCIGNGVKSIARFAFYKCTSLTKAEFASISSLCGISFGAEANPLYYAHHLYVDGSEVTELVIPEGVTTIGDDLFNGCSSLTSISLPSSMISLGSRSFGYCKSLTDIYCYAEDAPELQNNTFTGCTSSPLLHVPEGTIDKYKASAWKSFKITVIGIEEIVIDEIRYRIYTTEHSKALTAEVMAGSIEETEIVIPSAVEYKGDAYRVTSIDNKAFENHRNLISIIISEGVTTIGENVFSLCQGLTSIVIPNSVTSIGNSAFYRCYSLTSIVIPNNVTSIGNYTFCECYSLTSVVIPNSVTSIGDYAFNKCSSLTSVVIPNSVTSIGNSAFYRCYSLTSVVIPNSVTSIGNSAFSECSSLTSVVIPNSVTSIDNSAFKKCKSLTSLVIPNSVTSIGKYAFYSCPLTSVYCLAENVPSTVSNAFDNTVNAATLYVPEASVGAYKATTPWGMFGTIVGLTQDMIDGIKDIEHSTLGIEETWYSLDGKRLDVPQKGINIVNGRKVLKR